MSFQQGLSGLNAASRNLDVIGNNVANANTVGAKSSRAEFADVYATSLYGAGGSGFNGIGVTVADVTQQFTQGDISTTNSALDMAINGRGFFRMPSDGELTYTRNGQFQLDKDGYIVNAGWPADRVPADANGVVNIGVPTELRLQTGDVAPRATDAGTIGANLDAGATRRRRRSASDASSYNGATSLAVYDSQGAAHTVAVYFRKVSDNNWDVYAAADGTQVGAGALGSFSFGADGRLAAASPTSVTVNVPVPAAVGGNLPVPIDLSRLTQFGSAFSVSELSQTGYAAGRLTGFTVASDGTVLSRYTNGQTLAQGRWCWSTSPIRRACSRWRQPVGRDRGLGRDGRLAGAGNLA